jgi:hypothetical protein
VWEEYERKKEPLMAEMQLRETNAVLQRYAVLKAPFLAELLFRGEACCC